MKEENWRWFFLLSGIYGILLLLPSVEGIVWNPAAVYLTETGILLFLWFCCRNKKDRMRYYAAGLLFFACVLFFVLSVDKYAVQLKDIYACIMQRQPGGTTDATEAVALLMALATDILFVLEILRKRHWPLYLCITVLMLGSAFVGIEWKTESIFFIMLFQFSFWMLYNLEKSSGSLSADVLGRLSLAGLAGAFLLAAVLVHWKADWFYQAVCQVEGTVRRNIRRASGTTENFSDGVINRGNIYPAGVRQIRVRVSQKPSEEIYLKNFSGGTYTDGKWSAANDEILFEQMNDHTLHWEQWAYWIPGMYGNLYYTMNKNMENHADADSRELFIEYNENSAGSWYVPYYSRWDRKFSSLEGPAEYRMEYFEQGEMEIHWGHVRKEFETVRDWCYVLQAAYLKEAKIAYTEVAEEQVPELADFCKENPMEGQEEITEFICNYLRDNISYTQTPGMIPHNTDPVEYFLFEKKEGYCQHFASAAVLMYRMYGIPARYAAGYRVSPSDFEYQEDGSWHAIVTDQSAHAWPEIFIENYGWTPVEVTFSMEGGTEQAGEGEERQNLLSGNNLQFPDISDLRTDTGEKAGFSSETSPSEREADRAKITGRIFISCISVSLLLAIVWSIIWNYRIKWNWMRKGGIGRIYRQLLLMLHFAGYLKEYDGSEKEFSAKLAEVVPTVSPEEAEQLVNDVNEEAFGRPEPVKPEKLSFAEGLYRRIEKSIFSGMAVHKRIGFYIVGLTRR